jgi:Tn3 transposase DDE domain
VKTEAEQQLWNECSRLIANAVIYYNTALLSRVYEHKRAAGDQQALVFLAGLSPVAWQHVRLFGAFDFRPPTSPVDLGALAALYADPVSWDHALQEESVIR